MANLPPMKTVFSSMVNAVGYNADAQELFVKFKNNKVAVYQSVPADVAALVVDAPSVGNALNSFIKGKYGFGYIPGA